MKKVQVKILENSLSSKEVCDFLKKMDSSKAEILFDDGQIIKVLIDKPFKVLENELTKKFNVDFEIREIK